MEQHIDFDNTYMNVIKFGTGKRNLTVIAGVSLTGLEGLGPQLEAALDAFCKDFTVYVFDRKKVLPEGYSMEQMSEDIFKCLQTLNVNKTSVYGASQGGMIGQLLTLNHPDLVENLVLCSSTSCITTSEDKLFNEWGSAARGHQVERLNQSFLDYVYSDRYKEAIKDYIPAFLKNGTAADCDRFMVLLESMKGFNITSRLPEITCPVFVLCDKNDKVIDYKHSVKIAEKLKCKIKIYEDYSHAVYDEAPDLKALIADFCITE